MEKLTRAEDSKLTVELPDQNIKRDKLTFSELDSTEKNRLILGREAIAPYYLKPIHKFDTTVSFINPKHLLKSEIDELHILDKKLDKIGKILNLSRLLKPTNYLEELDQFITRQGHYNPKFSYRWLSDDKIAEVEEELNTLQDKHFGATGGFQSAFARLFADKIGELRTKLELISAYKKQKYSDILRLNERLYGELEPTTLSIAKEKVFETENDTSNL